MTPARLIATSMIPLGMFLTALQLIVSPKPQSCRESIDRRNEMRSKGVNKLLQGDHRRVHGDVHCRDYLMCLVTYRRSDRVQLTHQLFIVDGEIRLSNLGKLVA